MLTDKDKDRDKDRDRERCRDRDRDRDSYRDLGVEREDKQCLPNHAWNWNEVSKQEEYII